MAEVSEEVSMQSAVNCDTCGNTAEHLCKTCHDKLCSRCKDIHARSKSSFDHNVMPLTFESLSLSSEFPSVQVCRSHPGFRANICCKECEVPVCEQCLVGDHNGHKLVATMELFQEKKGKMESKLSFVESELPKYEAKLDAIRKRQNSQVERTQVLKSQINSHFEEAKLKLEEEKNRILEIVNVKGESEIFELRSQESQMLEYIRNIHSFMSGLRNAVPAERNTFILYANPSTGSIIPEIFPFLPTPLVPQFSESSLDKTAITNLSGKIFLQSDSLQTDFFEIEEIFAGNKSIESLSFQSNDNTFWVYLMGKQDFAKIDRSGNILRHVSAPVSNNKAICASPDGIIFFRGDTHVIMKMNHNEEASVFADFSYQSAFPICIYLLKEEEGIAIGVVNSKITEGKILRYNRHGQVMNEIISPFLFRWLIQASREGLKREPTYITENVNGDICISNTAVDVFNKKGEFRFSYMGIGEKSDTFLSRGICADILGHILIADKISNSIHILNIEGKLLNLMDIQGLGKKIFPISLTIDANYYLCVGCSDGRIKVLKYIE